MWRTKLHLEIPPPLAFNPGNASIGQTHRGTPCAAAPGMPFTPPLTPAISKTLFRGLVFFVEELPGPDGAATCRRLKADIEVSISRCAQPSCHVCMFDVTRS